MKQAAILTLVILMSGLILAAGNGNMATQQQERQSQITKTFTNDPTSDLRKKIRQNEELVFERGRASVRTNNDELEIRGQNGALVKTKLQLHNEGNASKLKVRLGNGQNAEIKIMPETASQKAIEKLRLKNCNQTINNCTIELKEVGQGNKTRAVYEAKVKKKFRLFGVFKSEKEVTTQIDAETGEEVKTKRPWWSWMASEDEVETQE
jgi:hypothetical protein